MKTMTISTSTITHQPKTTVANRYVIAFHALVIAISCLLSIKVIAAEPALTTEQVKKFLERNRNQILTEYRCLENRQTSSSFKNCQVVCQTGSAPYLDTANVNKAYMVKRLRPLDSGISGYFLIIDIVSQESNQDIWAVLQEDSSCYFKGMTPMG